LLDRLIGEQLQQPGERRKSPMTDGSSTEAALLSSIRPSLAAAFELPGIHISRRRRRRVLDRREDRRTDGRARIAIHISRIETLDFEDDALSRCLSASVLYTELPRVRNDTIKLIVLLSGFLPRVAMLARYTRI